MSLCGEDDGSDTLHEGFEVLFARRDVVLVLRKGKTTIDSDGVRPEILSRVLASDQREDDAVNGEDAKFCGEGEESRKAFNGGRIGVKGGEEWELHESLDDQRGERLIRMVKDDLEVFHALRPWEEERGVSGERGGGRKGCSPPRTSPEEQEPAG
jgi:hypothetical protein